MTHLTADQFVDAAEGALDAQGLRHLAACDACRREVSALVHVLAEARGGPVPEPSPLFWPHLSARVRQAIQAEEAAAPPPHRWRGWLRWPALVPLGALAALILAMVATVPRTEAPAGVSATLTPEEAGPVAPAEDAADADREWHALAELVGPLDWDTAGEAGLALTPGDAELAVLDLSDDERRELGRLISAEMARAKS